MHDDGRRRRDRFRCGDETIVFRAGLGFARFRGCNAHIQLSDQLAKAYDAFACDFPARPNNWVTRSNRLAASPDISALADSTLADGIQAGTTLVFTRRKQFGDGSETRFRLEQQHEELLAHDRLELREREARACVVRAGPPQCLQAALVDHSARHSDIEQTANDAFPETAAADLRFQLGDARLQPLAVLRRHLRLWRYFGIRRDADRGLHHGRSIDAEKERLTERFLRVAPLVEDIDDVLRDGLLEA